MRVTETYSQSSKDSENITDLYLPEKNILGSIPISLSMILQREAPKKVLLGLIT